MTETRKLERVFHVRPAYDCIGVQPCAHGSESCKPGTGGSHGRHNAEMHLTVRGEDAEVTLVVGTGWDLPTVPDHHTHRGPTGRFVEMHTARPRYEGQYEGTPRPDGSCKDWAACYTDQGYRMADEPTRLLVEKGSEAAWEWLENLHAETRAEMDALPTITPDAQVNIAAVESALVDAIDHWMRVPSGDERYAHGNAQGIARALAGLRSTTFSAEWEAGLDRYQSRVVK